MRYDQANITALIEYHLYLRRCTDKDRNKTISQRLIKHISDYILKLINLSVANLKSIHIEESCDILVITTCETDYLQTEGLWNELERKGYRITVTNDQIKNLIRSTFLSKVSVKIPACLIPFASFASLVIKKYNPVLICIFTHFNVLPSFLRYYSSAKTIYIPHAIMDSTYLYSSLDFDYYFVFGESSIKNIKANKNRHGTTKVIKTGSPVIRSHFSLPQISPNNNLLFFSTWTIGKDKEMTANFHLMLDWVKQHKKYVLYIKPHPIEDTSYITEAVTNIDNIQILDNKVDMVAALQKISLVITNYSTASIEASLMNRPVVVINRLASDKTSDDFRISDKYLYLEDFFPPRATTSEEIEERVNMVFENYEYYIEQCRSFSKFHLENMNDSIPKMADIIGAIYHGKGQFSYEQI